jgi:hypothetical protein
MRHLRQLILSGTLALLVALIALSIAGAFMGSARAAAMFNSPPMIIFWILLAWLFTCGLVFFPRWFLSPGYIGMHAGCLLILLGGMLGSQAGHLLLGRVRGGQKVRSGEMILGQGDRSSEVIVRDEGKVYGAEIPFDVGLGRAWVEHYEPAGLALGRAPAATDTMPAGATDLNWQPLDWQLGKPVQVGSDGATLIVKQYLPSARAIPGPGVLHVRDAAGKVTDVAAELGCEVVLELPAVTVRVAHVYQNLWPRRRPLSAPRPSFAEAFEERPLCGRPLNPAVELSFTAADGNATSTLVFHRPHLHGRLPEGIEVEYDFPGPLTAAADDQTHAPAMQVSLVSRGHAADFWLAADPAWPHTTAPLGAAPAMLAMAEPAGPVKAYRAELTLYKNDSPVAARTIAVNHPLHYGGYHLSLASYQTSSEGAYVVLAVRSDTGLAAVYAGFALLAAGMAWQFYVVPLLGRRRKEEQEKNSAAVGDGTDAVLAGEAARP